MALPSFITRLKAKPKPVPAALPLAGPYFVPLPYAQDVTEPYRALMPAQNPPTVPRLEASTGTVYRDPQGGPDVLRTLLIKQKEAVFL